MSEQKKDPQSHSAQRKRIMRRCPTACRLPSYKEKKKQYFGLLYYCISSGTETKISLGEKDKGKTKLLPSSKCISIDRWALYLNSSTKTNWNWRNTELRWVKVTIIFATICPHCIHLWAPSVDEETGRMKEKKSSRCISVR